MQHLPPVGNLGVEFWHGCGFYDLCLVAPLIRAGRSDDAASLAHLHGRFHEIETLGTVCFELCVDLLERRPRCLKLDGFN